jgi:NADH-quinone oxidoreductase subunit C
MSQVEQRRVAPQEWHDAVRTARDEGYAYFDWLSAVDETDADPVAPEWVPEVTPEGVAEIAPEGDAIPAGFDVVCHLIDVRGAGRAGGLRRVLLLTRVPDGQVLTSVTDLFAGAAWHERETAEMFGIGFEGFDDGTGMGLRPLLLPDGFEGTPLRKEFVLAARASKPWPGAKEPGEGEGASARRSPSRRRLLPPGVPDPSWGPR